MSGWPRRLFRYDTIDSTNSEALRLAKAGERGPVWIHALKQTAGRGRRGRAWECPAGNLAVTLLLVPGRSEKAQLSFATALAVADTAVHFAAAHAVTVKWPNDVLADGRKLAGILLEGCADGLAIGIGINLVDHPRDTIYPATSLAALGCPPPTLDAALEVLADAFARWYDRWMTDGFSPLRAAWLARAEGLGAQIHARLPHEEVSGVFEGIDVNGALLLNQNGTLRVISAGEVFF